MKTKYAKMTNDEVAAERLKRFSEGPSKDGNREINKEFRLRFPRACNGGSKKPLDATQGLPVWLTDETPSFLERAPQWMRDSAAAKGIKLSMFDE